MTIYTEPATRKWQGVPTIEKTGHRLWAAWFSGGKYEPCIHNYAILAYSDDEGQSWVDPYALIEGDPSQHMRVFDPQLWRAPDGRLWLFWCRDYYLPDAKPSDYDTPDAELKRAYFGRLEQWVSVCDNPDAENPCWSKPRYLWSGFTKNNVEVLSDGRWMVSAYDKSEGAAASDLLFDTRFIISEDNGVSFRSGEGLVRRANGFCEPMTVEQKDGTLWCLIRTMKGYLDQAFSGDGGKTWTPITPTDIPNPATRFYIGRLADGALLLVNTPRAQIGNRTGLVASLSYDEGKSWAYHFEIDDRHSTTYPDVAMNEDGSFYIIYDCQRDNRQEKDKENPNLSHAEKEICMARLTAQDIRNGALVNPDSFLRRIISKVHYSDRTLG